MNSTAKHIYLRIAMLFTTSMAFTHFTYAQAWFNASWSFRKAITVDFTKVPNTDQTNFPVLVSLTADAGLSAHALASGNDILFTLSDGTTKIPYQRESYSAGTLAAWVQVPTLSHTANTVIYMYYGNAGAADQQQAANVWDANYAGVYHLNEPGAGTAGEYKESKANTNNGTVKDAVLKGVFTMTASANSFCYQKLTTPTTYVIQSGDVLVYDVYWTSSTDDISFDFTTNGTTNGGTLRDNGATDQNGIGAHPATDLSAFALNKWYHRVIPIPTALFGTTINNYDVVCEFDGAATKTGYFDNIYILSSTGNISKVVYTQAGAVTSTLDFRSATSISAAITSAQDITVRSVSGKISSAVNTDGARFLNMTGRAMTATDNFTLEAWVNPNVLSQHGYFVYNGNQGAGYGIGIGNGTGNSGSKLIGLYGTNGFVPSGFTFPSASAWYHVVLQRSGGTTGFFVNGSAVSAASNATLTPGAPNNFLTIGNELDASSNAYKYFNGPIDEVRLSTSVRSADWIATEYNNQSSPASFYSVGTETLFAAATISSFTPDHGCSNTTPVVITGTNFNTATAVKFGGTDAFSFVINSATQITAIPAAAATGKITVINPVLTATSATNFTVNSTPTASATKTDVHCFNASDGTIIVTGSGGSGSYTYSVTNGVVSTIPPLPAYQAGNTFNGLPTGAYLIRVRDSNGCESKSVQ
jgi:hypothetical protein